MCKEIWKYRISLHESISYIEMQKDAEILDIGVQHKDIQIWALVDPNAGVEIRKFSIYGTGFRVDTKRNKHLKTIQVQGGDFIWHIFEIIGD